MASYSWFRVHHGMVSDPKWPLIARRSGHNVGTVVAVWAALLDFASQNEERGSIAGFNAEEIDALYGYDDGTTAQILQAMEDRGMVVDDVIVSWEKRQASKSSGDSKSTAMSPAERSRRYRERQRASRNETTESRDVTACHEDETSRHVTQRDATETTRDATAVKRDVTAYKIREDKNREENIDPPLPPLQGEPDACASAVSASGDGDEHVEFVGESPTDEPEQVELSPEQPKRKRTDYRRKDFEEWKTEYGAKVDDDRLWKVWKKQIHKIPEQAVLMAALAKYKQSKRWQDGYRKDPDNYLRGCCWNDDFTPAQPPRRYYGPDSNGRSPYVNEDEQNFDNLPVDENGYLDWQQVMGGAK